jgi:hypothetical protein
VAEHAQSSASGIIWVGFKAFCLPQIEQVHQVIIGYRLSNRPYYQWIGSREKLQEIMGFYHEKSWVFRLKFPLKQSIDMMIEGCILYPRDIQGLKHVLFEHHPTIAGWWFEPL